MEDLFEQMMQGQERTNLKRRKRFKKLTESEELKARALKDAMGASMFSSSEHIDAERDFLDRDHDLGEEIFGSGEMELSEVELDSIGDE